MVTQHVETVVYEMPLGDARLPMNPLLGKVLTLTYGGAINCIHCDRKTKKSFSQGYCYPCFTRLAQCDNCIVSPEKCHFDQGTCREPDWGEANCMIDHIVYLANTSGLKIGITRSTQVPTRWMDQGAIQAIPIFRVQTRYQSGLVEVLFKSHINDRTNWRAMLKGEVEELALAEERDRLCERVEPGISELQQRFGLQAITPLTSEDSYGFNYPVLEYPVKVVSHNLDKNPVVEGTLLGIKGQYLIFDTGVINMRKYGGYHIALSTP
jgi:hypothetical protein